MPAAKLLQLGRKLADQVLNLLGLMAVTNQDGIIGSHHDKIVHAEQRNVGPSLIEDNVVRRINRGDRAIRGVIVLVVFEIFRHRPPTSDIVPIKTRFHNQDTIGLFHDRVIK